MWGFVLLWSCRLSLLHWLRSFSSHSLTFVFCKPAETGLCRPMTSSQWACLLCRWVTCEPAEEVGGACVSAYTGQPLLCTRVCSSSSNTGPGPEPEPGLCWTTESHSQGWTRRKPSSSTSGELLSLPDLMLFSTSWSSCTTCRGKKQSHHLCCQTVHLSRSDETFILSTTLCVRKL